MDGTRAITFTKKERDRLRQALLFAATKYESTAAILRSSDISGTVVQAAIVCEERAKQCRDLHVRLLNEEG